MMKWAGALTVAGFALAGFAVPLVAQGNGLAALTGLTPGQWEVRDRGDNRRTRICVREGYDLIQLRHRGQSCGRHVVESGVDDVTVQYTCKGNGYGRTHVRRETATLVQIESQGIVGGVPFEFTAEARRVGECR